MTNCDHNLATTTQVHWVGVPQQRDLWINPTVPAAMGPYGLFDHVRCAAGGVFCFVRDYDCERSWMEPMSWGNEKKVVVEDSKFYGCGVFDSDTGGRAMVRQSEGTDTAVTNHGSEGDPAATSGPGYHAAHGLDAALQMEVYDFDFLLTPACPAAIYGNGVFFIRAGTLRSRGCSINRSTGGVSLNSVIKAVYYRSAEGGGSPTVTDRFYPADYLGTQQIGCGVVASAGEDPNFPLKKWGSVPVCIWNLSLGFAPTFYVAAANTFVQPYYAEYPTNTGLGNGRDIRVSLDGAAAPAGHVETAYPHSLQGGYVPPSVTPARIYLR